MTLAFLEGLITVILGAIVNTPSSCPSSPYLVLDLSLKRQFSQGQFDIKKNLIIHTHTVYVCVCVSFNYLSTFTVSFIMWSSFPNHWRFQNSFI